MDKDNEFFLRSLAKLVGENILGNFHSQNVVGQESKISVGEYNCLVGYASILSLSDIVSDKSLAYEIIARLLESVSTYSDHTALVADSILARLGNFPGSELLQARFPVSKESVSFQIAIEKIARRAENTITEGVALTDFQIKLYESLKEEKSLSVSAPTSAGKSHVLNLDLIRRVVAENVSGIVYLVPTRALISEVSARIRTTLRNEGLENVLVKTVPIAPSEIDLESKVVYVLTQERLLSLLKPQNKGLKISSIFVDEAHELGKGKRGVTLENAIDLVLKRFPFSEIYFVSPLIKNPGSFLSLFNRVSSGKFFTETFSPVLQNIILVDKKKGKPSHCNLSLLRGNEVSEVGSVDAALPSSGVVKRTAAFVKSITRESSTTIVFANGPGSAETMAKEISDLKLFPACPEIYEFIQFIKEFIHEEHPLLECLPYSVGFHYGELPSIVRAGIEELFKNNHLKVLCCTSTLLQGVNLPAKNIVIDCPKSGDDPLSRSDFLNLSGRAGRLLKEFSGNIWCLRPGDWAEKVYLGEPLSEIQSSMQKLMSGGGELVDALLNNRLTEGKEKELAEAGLSTLYFEIADTSKEEVINKYSNDVNSAALELTISSVEKLRISLPKDILEAHRSIRPDALQKMYDLLSKVKDLANYELAYPFEQGAKNKVSNALDIIYASVDWLPTDRQKNFFSNTSYNWVCGRPIREIIEGYIKARRAQGATDSVSSLIRDILKCIEKEIRYKFVKYFSAYEDILSHVLLEMNIPQSKVTILPYHLYFEFGSCDKHALTLMTLGFSRFTALQLVERKIFHNENESADYLKTLAANRALISGLPRVSQREYRDIIGA